MRRTWKIYSIKAHSYVDYMPSLRANLSPSSTYIAHNRKIQGEFGKSNGSFPRNSFVYFKSKVE